MKYDHSPGTSSETATGLLGSQAPTMSPIRRLCSRCLYARVKRRGSETEELEVHARQVSGRRNLNQRARPSLQCLFVPSESEGHHRHHKHSTRGQRWSMGPTGCGVSNGKQRCCLLIPADKKACQSSSSWAPWGGASCSRGAQPSGLKQQQQQQPVLPRDLLFVDPFSSCQGLCCPCLCLYKCRTTAVIVCN